MQRKRATRTSSTYPVTPDGRYFVVRGRLWRMADPALPPARRATLVAQLMQARRALRGGGDSADAQAAREFVHLTKVALGERGTVWWSDGARDFNRFLVKNTPYAGWYESVTAPTP